MDIQKEYYIEEDFATLAGPYYDDDAKDQEYLRSAVKLLKAGKIQYRLVDAYRMNTDNGEQERIGVDLQRKGMILTKGTK